MAILMILWHSAHSIPPGCCHTGYESQYGKRTCWRSIFRKYHDEWFWSRHPYRQQRPGSGYHVRKSDRRKGLTSSSLSADVTAQLTALTFKGYTYRNARVDGQISGKQFNGTLDINDPNVDMHFEGDVDMRDSLPKLDFIARIDSIHFHQLGLTKDSLSIQGIFDMDMTVGRFDQLQGTLHGEKSSWV